jgi:hypothetical protein
VLGFFIGGIVSLALVKGLVFSSSRTLKDAEKCYSKAVSALNEAVEANNKAVELREEIIKEREEVMQAIVKARQMIEAG